MGERGAGVRKGVFLENLKYIAAANPMCSSGPIISLKGKKSEAGRPRKGEKASDAGPERVSFTRTSEGNDQSLIPMRFSIWAGGKTGFRKKEGGTKLTTSGKKTKTQACGQGTPHSSNHNENANV